MQQRLRFCGIDLGSHALHLACLTEGSGGQRGLLTASAPAPGPWVGGCPAAADVAGAVASAAGSLSGVRWGPRLRPTPAAVSLPTGALVVRAVNLPPLKAGELREALYLEIDRLRAGDPAETVGDWLPLAVPGGEDPARAGRGYLLLTARQAAVDTAACALRAARLRPVAVEPEPAVLIRLARLLAAPGGEAVEVLVDLGAGGTRLVVARADALLLFRELPVGGSHLTAALAERRQVTLAEAEELKCTEYQEAGSLADFGPAGERLVRELERSLRYVERQHRLEGYASLHLVGGGARWPLLRREIEGVVGVRARDSVALPAGAVPPEMAGAAALCLWKEGAP